MKKSLIFLMFLILTGCQLKLRKEIQNENASSKTDSVTSIPVEKIAADLKGKGYNTFIYEEGDTTYLMQQYFLVLLKAGPIRNQDSTETANLQKQHLAHLERMGKEGYASLIGPLEGHDEIMGIAVYNTPKIQQADSLANLDPMVKAGRLKVEVYPWWAAKGSKLN